MAEETSKKKKKSEITIPPSEFKMDFDPTTIDTLVDDDVKTRDMYMFPLDRISPVADFNVRIGDPGREERIEKIKESIKQNGFLRQHPLKGYAGKEGDTNLLYLVGGYTRYEAAKRAVAEGLALERVPVVFVNKGTSTVDLLYGLEIDNDGERLKPFERGLLIKRLLALDQTEDQIATGLGFTKQYVSDLIVLMAAPKGIHNMVTSGEVSAALAVDMIREKGSGKLALETLRAAGATGEDPKTPGGRATRGSVNKAGGSKKAFDKRLYEVLIEHLVVLGSSAGAQSVLDFLIKFNEKDSDAIAEIKKMAKPKKKGAGKKKATKKKKKTGKKKEQDEPI